MRVYIPGTFAGLAQAQIPAGPAFAVTDALSSGFPGEDTEYVEFIAFLAAADSSLACLVSASPSHRRVVISADVPSRNLAPAASDHPGAVQLAAAVEWDAVAAIHVDEPGAADDVRSAIAGDQAAVARLEDRDLLWYAPQERASLLAELRAIPAPAPNTGLAADIAGGIEELLAPFRAVLFDLDGVLTPTAELHQRAWAELFTGYLAQRGAAPYTGRDYFEHIDGKPRREGVRTLLASRGLRLPEGDESASPDDESATPGFETVAGLAARKNSVFRAIVAADRVAPYPGTVAVLESLVGQGKAVAVVSSSCNARWVLEASGLAGFFEVVVDGLVAKAEHLKGKPAPSTFLFAARRLGVSPRDTAVIEDAAAGVAAARAGGFGLVIGVDRGSGSSVLIGAGADIVLPALDSADNRLTRPPPATP